MILDATTKKLQVVLGEAISSVNCDYVTCYSDITTSAFTPISADGTTNGVTPVDIVAAPASSTQREIQSIFVNNVDTITHNVSILYNDNGTTRLMVKVQLLAGEQLFYNSQSGWNCATISGANKVSPAVGLNSQFLVVPAVIASNAVQLAIPSTTTVIHYLGTSPKVSSSISVAYKVTQAIAGTTWAEMAIFRATNPQFTSCDGTAAQSVSFELLGYLDTSAAWLNAVAQVSTITLSTNTAVGDQLFVGFGNQATTPVLLRIGLADDIGAGLKYSTTARPSTTVYNRVTAITTGGLYKVAAYVN